MDVTREEFEAYEDVRRSGVTNMFDVRAVEGYSGLTRDTILRIMEHYTDYKMYLFDQGYASMSEAIRGTSYVGKVFANYDDIVAVYGRPFTCEHHDKVDVQWIITTDLGIATLYNYKDGKAHCGDKGLDTKAIKEWHIGGKTKELYQEVRNPLERYINARLGV